jgi:hypothetical protein
MDMNQVIELLRASDHTYGHLYVNSKKQRLFVIDGVPMFEEDAEDLADGRVSLAQIIERNKGKVLD